MNEPPNSAGDEIQLPRGERVDQLRNLIETLRIADEVANRGYLITSAEVADLMDINPGAVTVDELWWHRHLVDVRRVRPFFIPSP